MNKGEKHFVEKASELFDSYGNFYEWLQSLPPDQVVGYARIAKSCPIAGYASAIGFPVEDITFAHFDISFGDGHSFAVMGVNQDGFEDDGVDEIPYWFSDFVNIVDRIYKQGHPVSARSAKAIIDALKDDDLGEDPEGIRLEDVLRFER